MVQSARQLAHAWLGVQTSGSCRFPLTRPVCVCVCVCVCVLCVHSAHKAERRSREGAAEKEKGVRTLPVINVIACICCMSLISLQVSGASPGGDLASGEAYDEAGAGTTR